VVVVELNGGGVVEWECLKFDLSLLSNVFSQGKGREGPSLTTVIGLAENVNPDCTSYVHGQLTVLKK
jgi:hypothetical protein